MLWHDMLSLPHDDIPALPQPISCGVRPLVWDIEKIKLAEARKRKRRRPKLQSILCGGRLQLPCFLVQVLDPH